ncbi:hypothetical protein [Burkholderia sp. Ac-20365]|uniref:hypothetical protein n=1 Tax=Burkholderia sp. Ac-20365 TaxID=2703897 RepID=UPI00197B13F3|nr:hypothetical protein [Burkholderia sp. Ac-20365]MBN3761361.1 hypothetical protein [Burkholderia sp. Ac-20365]
MTSYQVGELKCFKPDDPVVEGLLNAYQLALEMWRRDDRSIIGVWTKQEDGSELVAIVYENEVFRK